MSWVPVSAQSAEPRGAGGAGILAAEDDGTSPPPSSDLDVMTWDVHQLDMDVAAKLGFSLAELSVEAHSRTLVAEWARSKTIDTESGGQRRYGVAARLIVNVTGIDSNAKLSLPMVAAEAQMSRAESTAGLRVEGYVDSDIGQLLPKFSSFDVETYVVLMDSLTAVKDAISANEADISPVELWQWEPQNDSDERLAECVATAWALTRIRRGESREQARRGYRDQNDPQALRTVNDVYSAVVGPNGSSTPSDEARAHAKALLDGYELHYPWGPDQG